MGVKITDLLVTQEIDISELKGKVVAIDSSLFMYQFLTTIRQQDGSLLTDSHGNVTSHLIGLFSRSAKLMEQGLKLVYVFDGKAPELKMSERARRAEAKEEASKKYELAAKEERLDDMKKYAARTARLTSDMVVDAKRLVGALGLPLVQAPAEGEAQAAYMVSKGDCYCVATQDADALMFGAQRIVRNLSLIGKKKAINKLQYVKVNPELISLADTLNELGIDRDQLITMCMLVGTDYNIGGIKGIGCKNALKLVRQFDHGFDALFEHVKWTESFDYPWKKVFDTIKDMPVSDEYDMRWTVPDRELLHRFLIEEHDFTEDRVAGTLDRLCRHRPEKEQKGLSDFF